MRTTTRSKEARVINGIHQVVLDVDDQERALDFWTKTMGFEVSRDEPYGDERWLEVLAPDNAVTIGAQPPERRATDGPRDAADVEHLLLLRRAD
jgi:catechol 2,3-dioxygenase-like lactoylglutathione lyase family enzyme